MQNYNNFNKRYNNQNRITSNDTGCYIYDRTNNFARECRQRNQNQGQNFNINRKQNPNNNGRRNNNNANNERPLHCTYCNKRSHKINNCYTKQRNEKNSTNIPGNGVVPNLSKVRFVHQIIDTASPQDDVFISQQL